MIETVSTLLNYLIEICKFLILKKKQVNTNLVIVYTQFKQFALRCSRTKYFFTHNMCDPEIFTLKDIFEEIDTDVGS